MKIQILCSKVHEGLGFASFFWICWFCKFESDLQVLNYSLFAGYSISVKIASAGICLDKMGKSGKMSRSKCLDKLGLNLCSQFSAGLTA